MSDTKTEYRTRDLTTTDVKPSNASNHTQPPEPEPKPKLIDLSATQLTGGALAAMTSAVIGARLGVAGTVLGAAVGSIVAGIAGTLYTTSLQRTKDRISSVIVAKTGDTEIEVNSVSVGRDRIADRDISTELAVGGTPTLHTPLAPDPAVPPAGAAYATASGRPRSRWKPILASTAAVFVLAFAAITGFEVLTGHAISGGDGTTITQVSDGRSGGSNRPSQAPSTQPSSDTSTGPSTEPSSEPSAEPSQPTAPSSAPSASAELPTATLPSTSDAPSAATRGQGDVQGQADGDDGTGAGR